MMTYLIPVLIVGGCGVLAGVLLTIVSKLFYVKVDERVQRISDALPQANCGACGFAGCADYADAIVNGGAETNLCRPGGKEAAESIAEILGTEAAEVVPMTAVVKCSGDCNAVREEFEFGGIRSCKAVKKFYGGSSSCKYGCIGLGDCAAVCDNDAISVKDGLARVTPLKCTACGKCAAVCPNELIAIKPLAQHIMVLCSSKDNGRNTRLACRKGCLGCKLCERNCVEGAIKVEENHAIINYDLCAGCGLCVETCPAKAIHRV
ncbi:MAG: RnfABCDGE type electron transport complex subunit B [Ruminococcus sp.]|nr:RnfABCDGE type electron transport complex subunit B [Ruminococcus sp.]